MAAELESVLDDLSEILGIQVCHRDPGVGRYGLENALLPIGTNFLEVVAPVQADTAAGRYLKRRGGDGGYMVITQADSRDTQAAIRQAALQRGVRVAHEQERDGWNFCQLHPADLEVSFLDIEWDQHENFHGCWHPAGGEDWADKSGPQATLELVGVELQCVDPARLMRLWAALLGNAASSDPDSNCLVLNNARLRFVEPGDQRGPGLSGIDLLVEDRQGIIERARSRDAYVSERQITICGTHFYLLDADQGIWQ